MGKPRGDCTAGSSLLGSASEELLTTDSCLMRAGGWGAYQRRLMLVLGACTATTACHMLAPIFLMPYLRSSSTWGLSAVQLGLIPSLFFGGFAAGVFAWGAVSDTRGRRPAIVLSFAVANVAGILSFLSPNFRVFLALRVVCGFGVAGCKNGCWVLATEFAPPVARAKVGALLSYSWLLGLIVLVAVAWALRHEHWRWLALTYLPALACQLVVVRYLPESPRYLLVAGEIEKARAVLRQVFKANGFGAPEPLSLKRPPASGGAERRSIFGQLCQRGTRRLTCIVGACQGICTMIFYGITFDARFNMTTGNLYVGALLGGCVELPAYLLLEPVTNNLGRRPSYCAFLLLSAASLLMLHFASRRADADGDGARDGAPPASPDWLAFAAVLAGRFSSVAAVNVAYIVAAEIFPTSCRNSAIGWGSGCGRIGAMAAPVLMYSTASPLLLFTALCVLAAAMVWMLPESAGPLADVADADPRSDPLWADGVELRRAGSPSLSSGGARRAEQGDLVT